MKIILAVLISTFKFSLPTDNERQVYWNFGAVQFPTVVGDSSGRSALPLSVSLMKS